MLDIPGTINKGSLFLNDSDFLSAFATPLSFFFFSFTTLSLSSSASIKANLISSCHSELLGVELSFFDYFAELRSTKLSPELSFSEMKLELSLLF